MKKYDIFQIIFSAILITSVGLAAYKVGGLTPEKSGETSSISDALITSEASSSASSDLGYSLTTYMPLPSLSVPPGGIQLTSDFYIFDSYVSNIDNDKFYYNQLSDVEKKLYNRLDDAIKYCRTEVDIADLGLQFGAVNSVIADAYRYDICWLPQTNLNEPFCKVRSDNNGLSTTIYIDYCVIDINAIKSFKDTVGQIIRNAQMQPTDYDKLRYIHDWLVDNSDPTSNLDLEHWEVTYADGPILKEVGNCNGYSRAFQYLARSLGFDCIRVQGYSNGSEDVNHAWNMVKLDNRWYNVDVCWDDRSHLGDNEISYKYFLVGDEDFSANHQPYEFFKYPRAFWNYGEDTVEVVLVPRIKIAE